MQLVISEPHKFYNEYYCQDFGTISLDDISKVDVLYRKLIYPMWIQGFVMAKTLKEPEDFLPLTPAEFHILMVLADNDLHGYGIMQEIESHTDGAITLGPGTLYTTIKRLLERGWIEEVSAPPHADDPRRKYYRLTPFGGRVVRAEAERLAQVVRTARNLGLLGGTS